MKKAKVVHPFTLLKALRTLMQYVISHFTFVSSVFTILQLNEIKTLTRIPLYVCVTFSNVT